MTTKISGATKRMIPFINSPLVTFQNKHCMHSTHSGRPGGREPELAYGTTLVPQRAEQLEGAGHRDG
jgi:hypothetical protein